MGKRPTGAENAMIMKRVLGLLRQHWIPELMEVIVADANAVARCYRVPVMPLYKSRQSSTNAIRLLGCVITTSGYTVKYTAKCHRLGTESPARHRVTG